MEVVETHIYSMIMEDSLQCTDQDSRKDQETFFQRSIGPLMLLRSILMFKISQSLLCTTMMALAEMGMLPAEMEVLQTQIKWLH